MEECPLENRQRKKPEDRKKEIIAVALELFLESGYETITMSDIAKKSEITKGLCYHYFPSKEALYNDALTEFVTNLTSDYLGIIKDQQLSLEKRMDKMATVLKRQQGHSLFYDFSRQHGNKRVYLDVLYQTFNRLIPELANQYILYTNDSPDSVEKIKTLMSFILFGQLGILTEKEPNFEEQLVQMRDYINWLLTYDNHGRSDDYESQDKH